MLDLNQESKKTATLFVINLILMILLLFLIVGILAITLIVSYAQEEVEELHKMNDVDSSIFKHNLYQLMTLTPTIMIVMQILINLMLITYENIDEVYFYIRENCQGIWMLKGCFGISLLIFTGLMALKL